MATITDAIWAIDDCYHQNRPNSKEPRTKQSSEFQFYTLFPGGDTDAYGHDFGAIYLREYTDEKKVVHKEAIYVSRGTVTMGDWFEDFTSIPNPKDGCYARIKDGVNNIKKAMEENPDLRGYQFSVVGHSLGGYIAQGISKELGLPGVAFNSPSNDSVRPNRMLIISNRSDLTASLGFDHKDIAILPPRKEPPEIKWEDKGNIFSSIGDFFGKIWSYVWYGPKDNHAVEDNIAATLDETILGTDYEKVLDPSCKNERASFVSGIGAIPGSTLRLGDEYQIGTPPDSLMDSLPSIVLFKNDLSGGKSDETVLGLQYSLPLQIQVDGIGNLFHNVFHFFEGEKLKTINTEDGQTLLEINQNGTPVINNPPEPSEEPNKTTESSNENSPNNSSKIKTFSNRNKNGSFPINMQKLQEYMDQNNLKQSLKALNGINCHFGFGGALGLFTKSIHPSSNFYLKATQISGLDQIEYLSCLYGRWLKPGEQAEPGDIVFVQSSFIKDSQAWGVMIEQKDEANMDVLLTGILTAYVATGLPMTVIKGFKPSLNTVLNENSPSGKFWGPLMSYLKMMIEKPQIEKIDTYISKILKDKGYKIESFNEFTSTFKDEIKPVTDINIVPFGSIVFDEKDSSVGIWLSNYQIHGFRFATDFANGKSYSLVDFKVTSYWEPHLPL